MADNKLTLKVTGMTCDHCVETVLSALSAVPGAKFADVRIKENQAIIEYDDAVAKPQDFVVAVDEAGYGAELV